MQPRPSRRVAVDLGAAAAPGRVLRVEIFAVLILLADGLLVLFFSVCRQSRRLTEFACVVPAPYAREIMSIECMTFNFVLRVVPAAVRVILATGTAAGTTR